MKRTTLLHPALSHCIAGLGHGDMLVIADAGLPIPAPVDGRPERIDLGFARGEPSLEAVLRAVLSEMQVESAWLADEALARGQGALPAWYAAQPALQGLAPKTLPHEDFKALTRRARAIVRSGECTPYANVILVAGVCF